LSGNQISSGRDPALQSPRKLQVLQPEPLITPSWPDVEKVLDGLARTSATILTTPTLAITIGGYERGRRVLLQSSGGRLWLDVDSIRECWGRFEEMGRIRRSDVLEPGRCSAFMIALFRQVPGVSEEHEDEVYLVLPA
jgi:hypothetical protein